MTTWTALTTLRDKAEAEALGLALENMEPEPTGVGVFEVEDGSGTWEVGGYFTDKPDLAGLALLEAMHGARPFAVSKLDDVDWVAQVRRELTPVPAGRFVVYGSHDRDTIPANKIGLEIEAAMAFGTGHHGTTQGCLLSLDKLLQKGFVARNVADIGAGTAVLAMAAVASMPCRAIASDIDPVATMTARANTVFNGYGADVRCVTAPGFRHPDLIARAPYDLVFANILAGPLKRLAPQIAAHTAPGAIVILSGILRRQGPGVEAMFRAWGFEVVDRRYIDAWVTFTLRRL
ncbi:ribosomal protein L11 methyltransferase [Rubricella aquisinus]|uniref:Ribosomal protein L11 methyltransferase n=1 Tax=Rubricella aquisinus TaxID=2028108 RepID=A0A840X265_9RHOB|nr:50S ribosomal protein L11 methyltransferase [Rubricella aquisinus]MBB5515975.1 ribosomal protein L11 methyltransferase [Rubricella aquisinus]